MSEGKLRRKRFVNSTCPNCSGGFVGYQKVQCCSDECRRLWTNLYHRNWNKQNYGAAKAAQDKYRKKNMEKTNERQRAWRRNNPDKTKAYHAKWYYENRESHLANLRQKRRGNPDHLEKKRKWRNKNIEKERASSRHRNMIMRAAYNAVKELGILEIIKHEIQTTA